MHSDHLLISQYVLHNEVFIFLADCLIQFLFVIRDELLNVHVVCLVWCDLISIDLLRIRLCVLLLFHMPRIELSCIYLVTALLLAVCGLIHDRKMTRASH